MNHRLNEPGPGMLTFAGLPPAMLKGHLVDLS